jgi:DNA polymerase III delta prime subunit
MSATATAQSQALNTLNVVSQQIQNLLNVHVTKYIDTGDRVVDNGLTLIMNSCIALVGAFLYSAIIKTTLRIYNTYVLKRKVATDDPTDIDYDTFDYSKWSSDTITKYTHVVPSLSRVVIDAWLASKNINPNCNKQLVYEKLSTGVLTIAGFEQPAYFMPLWKYTNVNGKYEYVWLIETKLYSNNIVELRKLYLEICNMWNKQNTAVKNSRDLYNISDGDVTIVGHVNKNKIFNNIYFNEKPGLLDMLNKFKKGDMYPNAICDNKLGILLYGPPGTGKTGTISAIANYLDRNIIMMHDTSHNSITALQTIIKQHKGVQDFVIVFDEFDHILCDNENEAMKYMKEYKLNKLRERLRDETDADERKDIKNEIDELQNNGDIAIGMGDLLRFLDGMEDQSGRLIIATTNYPNKINERLLRPGRFDLKLELGYCTQQMFCDIVHNKFPDDIGRLSELVHTCSVVAVATTKVATATDTIAKTDEVIEVTETQTTTIPMEQHIARLLKKKITPINLIVACVKANTFSQLIEFIEALAPDIFAYSAK